MSVKHSYVALFLLTTAGCLGAETAGTEAGSDVSSDAVTAITNGTFTIKAGNSGKCLDIAAASTANGAALQQYDCNGTGAQKFNVTSLGGGYYEITNANSNKSLDVTDVSTAPLAPLQQWDYGGGANQQFRIDPVGDGSFRIIARHSGLSFDVSGGSMDNSARIVQYPAGNGTNQHFWFDSVAGGGTTGGGTTTGWKLVWSDEFDGNGVDGNKWTQETGGSGWGNNELEYYTDNGQNASVSGGNLTITATPQNASSKSCWYGACQYTSARLITKGKFNFTYGKAEVRVKVPAGQGLWPAFWMLGANIDSAGWPTCGEVDIMEMIGSQPGVNHGSMHGPGYSGNTPETATYTLPGGASFADAFHTFGVEWETNVVRFYVDGNLYQTRTPADLPAGTKWVYDHPFFLLLNVAVGGAWPGNPNTTFPKQMVVDYVRVYSR